MSDNPISVGIVGFGRSGCGIHADAIALQPGRFRIAAVCDPLPERQADARKLGATAYAGIDELLRDPAVELVIVASPNRFHAGHARQALDAGRHVLCEKPFGFTVADVDAMISAAQRAGRVLQPFQQRRFEPDFNEVRRVIRSGVLGTVTRMRICLHGFSRRWDWQTDRGWGGGQLYNNGPHPLDHALELFGDAEPLVACELRRSLCSGAAEDEVAITLSAPGHPTIQIELLATAAYAQDKWWVCGTAGGLRSNGNRLEWRWVDWSRMPARPLDLRPTPDRSYNGEKLEWQESSWQPTAAGDGGAGAPPAKQPTLDLYASLWDAVRLGRPQVITPASVRRRVAVLERCYRLSGIAFPEGALGA